MLTLVVTGLVLLVTRPVLASLAPSAVPDGLAIPVTVTRTSISLDGHVELIGYELGQCAQASH